MVVMSVSMNPKVVCFEQGVKVSKYLVAYSLSDVISITLNTITIPLVNDITFPSYTVAVAYDNVSTVNES